MKTGRKVGLVLAGAAIVAALVVAYTIYSGQAQQRNDLNDRMARAQTFLPSLTNQKSDLQNQLAGAQSTLDTSQAQFPQSVESIEYGEYLYDIAHDCNVQLTSLSFPTPSSKTVGAVTYSVTSLILPVSGALDNIFDFIQTLRTDDRFASTEVTAITLSMGAGASTATISVTICAHKG
jgi:hypothetical protein